MRETMLGMVVVGLIAGVFLGRNTERGRRAFKDWGVAKAALKKGRGIAMTELRRAVITGLIIVAVLIGLFTFATNQGASTP